MRLHALALVFATLTVFSADAKPKVKFTTSLGSFTVELDSDAAPKTVANFLTYVRSGFYKGTTFHRVIPTFMVQGGGILPNGAEKPGRAPIKNEAKHAIEKGLKNVRGSIAMARTSDPHSATSQFFVNVVDNASLDYPGHDGWGYCVFGQVVDGMDTVDKIKDVKTGPANKPIQTVLITGASVEGEVPPAKKTSGKKKS